MSKLRRERHAPCRSLGMMPCPPSVVRRAKLKCPAADQPHTPLYDLL